MNGLAVVVIIFSGIIIQCEGNPNTTNEDLHSEGVTDNPTYRIRTNGMLETHIVLIGQPEQVTQVAYIIPRDDEFYIEFGDYAYLGKFIDDCHDLIKRILVDYSLLRNPELCAAYPAYITKCEHLKELRIAHDKCGKYWNELPHIFPEVTKFVYSGYMPKGKGKLSERFTALESLTLDGKIIDNNCMAGVTGLKELNLNAPKMMHRDKTLKMIARNINMEKLTISEPETPAVMQKIALNLMKLTTLCVKNPIDYFLFKSEKRFSCESVTHFIVEFKEMLDFTKELSFVMPKLEKLTVIVLSNADIQIIGFIDHFKRMETVKIIRLEYGSMQKDCIEAIIECFVKEAWTLPQIQNDETLQKYLMFQR